MNQKSYVRKVVETREYLEYVQTSGDPRYGKSVKRIEVWNKCVKDAQPWRAMTDVESLLAFGSSSETPIAREALHERESIEDFD